MSVSMKTYIPILTWKLHALCATLEGNNLAEEFMAMVESYVDANYPRSSTGNEQT